MSSLSVTDAITIGSAAAVGLATLFGGARIGVAWWQKTAGAKRVTRAQLDALGIGMSRGYLIDRLGMPIFQDQDILRFQLPHAWVSCLVKREAVTAFSITIVSRMPYRLAAICPPLHRFRLTSSVFDPTGERKPQAGLEWSLGARRGYYREMHYFGNPGWYQYYVLSANDAGHQFGVIGAELPFGPGVTTGAFASTPPNQDWTSAPTDERWLSRFRSTYAPNTISVLAAPDGAVARRVELNWDQVRMLWRQKPSWRVTARKELLRVRLAIKRLRNAEQSQ